ncbi:MAG: ABC transporter permease subunit [Bacilli bacterium]|nr:ABC transporter permease subunit [Bacilli bacterium]
MSKRFEIKRSLNIFKAEFKMRLKGTVIWLAFIVGIMFMYMFMYPLVEDIISEKMAAMPPELLQVFGMNGGVPLDNYNSYFAMIYQIIFIVLCCYCVSFGANALYEEEKMKSIEFLNSVKISRIEIYTGKFLVIAVNLMILIVGAIIATIIGGFAVSEGTMNLMAILSVYKLSGITLFFFVSLGFFLAAIFKRGTRPSMIGISILFGTYIIGYLGEIVGDKLDFLKMISPIHITAASPIMESNIGQGTADYNMLPVIILAILMFTLLIGGAIMYKKRDFT